MPTKMYLVTGALAAVNAVGTCKSMHVTKGPANKEATAKSREGYNTKVSELVLKKLPKKEMLQKLWNNDMTAFEDNPVVSREVSATQASVKKLEKSGKGKLPVVPATEAPTAPAETKAA